MARLRALLRRKAPTASLPTTQWSFGSLSIHLIRREVLLDGRVIPLTSIEFKLLVELARQPGEAVSREQLSDAVQAGSYRPLDRTVDVQVGRLRRRLGGVTPGSDWIETVRGEGYAFVPRDRWSMLPARFDSLFVRLLLAQLVLVLCCVLVFGAFVITERNMLQMPQFAEVWAPAFQAAVATQPPEVSAPVFGLPQGIRRQAGPPAGWTLDITSVPGPALLRQQLALRGVRVDAIWLSFAERSPRFWSHVAAPEGPGVWLSGQVPAVLPRWTTSATVTFTLLLLVIAGVSWNFARRVTRRSTGCASACRPMHRPAPSRPSRHWPPRIVARRPSWSRWMRPTPNWPCA